MNVFLSFTESLPYFLYAKRNRKQPRFCLLCFCVWHNEWIYWEMCSFSIGRRVILTVQQYYWIWNVRRIVFEKSAVQSVWNCISHSTSQEPAHFHNYSFMFFFPFCVCHFYWFDVVCCDAQAVLLKYSIRCAQMPRNILINKFITIVL